VFSYEVPAHEMLERGHIKVVVVKSGHAEEHLVFVYCGGFPVKVGISQHAKVDSSCCLPASDQEIEVYVQDLEGSDHSGVEKTALEELEEDWLYRWSVRTIRNALKQWSDDK